MARNSRILYDDDATVVEQVTVSDGVSAIKRGGEDVTIPVSDVLDALAGFVVPTVSFFSDGGKSGKCVICGAKTSKGIRKICVGCMKEYGEEIYNKAKTAAGNGEKEIRL